MWDIVATLANVVVGVAYLFITWAILVPLAKGRQLRKNVLGTATGCIFLSCAVGHLIHAEHALRGEIFGTASGADWHSASWDTLSAGIGVWYWSLRRLFPAIVSPGSLFSAEADRRYRALVAHLPDTFVGVVDDRLRFEAVGGEVLERLDLPATGIVGKRWGDLALGRLPLPGELLTVRTTTGDVLLDVELVPLPDEDGGGRSLVVARDVTEERLAAARLEKARRHFEQAFTAAPIGMALLDADQRLLQVNAGFASLAGRRAADAATLVGLRLADALQSGSLELPMPGRDGGAGSVEWLIERPDGPRWMVVTCVALSTDPGDDPSLLLQAEDITDRRRAEAHLSHLALHDPLTGLSNRAYFHESLKQALSASARADGGVAVLFLDLDGFKLVNDSLGHEVGDRVLCEVAGRLLGATRIEDTVGRMGGDEFTVLIEGPAGQAAAIAAAERIRLALATPIDLGDRALMISASVGISVSRPDTPTTAEALLREADTALYQAKARGRHRWELYDDSFLHSALDRLELEGELRAAVERDELEVHYQPQICTQSGRLLGAEALVRWRHPTRGLLLPAAFLSVAVDAGLMIQIGRFVLARACEDAARWSAQVPDFRVSINLCEVELGAPGLLEAVVRALDTAGLRPRQLCIEVNEQALLEVHGSSAKELHRLEALGVELSVDDFGTGASSLTHLTRFKVDEIKIDKSFVEGLGADDKRAGVIVEAVVALALAHALGARVVAEGAEELEQVALLRSMGCDVLQGYVVGDVLLADGIDRIIAA